MFVLASGTTLHPYVGYVFLGLLAVVGVIIVSAFVHATRNVQKVIPTSRPDLDGVMSENLRASSYGADFSANQEAVQRRMFPKVFAAADAARDEAYRKVAQAQAAADAEAAVVAQRRQEKAAALEDMHRRQEESRMKAAAQAS